MLLLGVVSSPLSGKPRLDGWPGESYILSEPNDRQRIFVALARAFPCFFANPTLRDSEPRSEFCGSQKHATCWRPRLLHREKLRVRCVFLFRVHYSTSLLPCKACAIANKTRTRSITSERASVRWTVALTHSTCRAAWRCRLKTTRQRGCDAILFLKGFVTLVTPL